MRLKKFVNVTGEGWVQGARAKALMRQANLLLRTTEGLRVSSMCSITRCRSLIPPGSRLGRSSGTNGRNRFWR